MLLAGKTATATAGPLVVEESGKHPLPALKSRLADLVSCRLDPAMLCSYVCRRWCRMVPRSHLLWWHPSHLWVYPAQTLHVDVYVHRSASGVPILRPVSEGEALCGDRVLWAVPNEIKHCTYYSYADNDVGLPSLAWPQQLHCSRWKRSLGARPFDLLVLVPPFWVLNVQCNLLIVQY